MYLSTTIAIPYLSVGTYCICIFMEIVITIIKLQYFHLLSLFLHETKRDYDYYKAKVHARSACYSHTLLKWMFQCIINNLGLSNVRYHSYLLIETKSYSQFLCIISIVHRECNLNIRMPKKLLITKYDMEPLLSI